MRHEEETQNLFTLGTLMPVVVQYWKLQRDSGFQYILVATEKKLRVLLPPEVCREADTGLSTHPTFPHQALSQRTQHSSFNEEKQLPLSPVSPLLGLIYLLRHFCSPHARPRKIQLRHSCPPAAKWEAVPLLCPPGWTCKPVYFSIPENWLCPESRFL